MCAHTCTKCGCGQECPRPMSLKIWLHFSSPVCHEMRRLSQQVTQRTAPSKHIVLQKCISWTRRHAPPGAGPRSRLSSLFCLGWKTSLQLTVQDCLGRRCGICVRPQWGGFGGRSTGNAAHGGKKNKTENQYVWEGKIESYKMEMEKGNQNVHGLEATMLRIMNKIINAVGNHRRHRDA